MKGCCLAWKRGSRRKPEKLKWTFHVDFKFQKRQLKSGQLHTILIGKKKNCLAMDVFARLSPVYKRDGIHIAPHCSSANTVYFLQTLDLPYLGTRNQLLSDVT